VTLCSLPAAPIPRLLLATAAATLSGLQSTAERLHAAEEVLRQWRAHLVASSSLHGWLPPDEAEE